MVIKEAKFLMSNTRVEECPAPDKPEYAFIGRSNVGKSSLINMLTEQKGLAKTSSSPGKTQLINHFLINDTWYLVDLPGYGYAKVSKGSRDDWRKMINYYFQKRENLTCIFVLIDSRHEPMKTDMDFINHLGQVGVPFVIVFTKADKQSSVKTDSTIAAYKRTLLQTWDELPRIFVTSSEKRTGRDELLAFIDEVNAQVQTQQ
ncbi:YihA family ribosome biogenesis GTP-binding protein [Pontibacter sp. BT310]|jgi:GTP-binding protein|uniref:Probable GTP-binding protein EngB n=1 Tax=Pontibacter populi TaxID=890055 RepID=A0ABS6XDB0_9BACT|nr:MULTISPECIES: ribosome biogenesis GTP-binding protein YihA/YsxC [Pontibacter]MBJ6118780.1 YihA family ribosome biogenesis GTP-binding protein [Pontibacter sp. BT310]MBR0571209.1 YihA family ribosome biogenesis GTP-binding protein [Microvirga sp. STS03]MBW3365634.1 ribosome biogenesis GTP-binding protein YihA/YsxC [Pontibacter populi]